MCRSQSTPISHAGATIGHLAAMYAEWWKPNRDKNEFVEVIFGRLWDDETTDGDDGFRQLEAMAEMRDMEKLKHGMLYGAFISCAYCVQAMKAAKADRLSEAWSYIADAKYWHGCVSALWAESGGVQRALSENARKAAIRRHAENHAMKALVVDWYKDNCQRFASMDKAAEAVAGKLVPVTFRTARGWIAEAKKLRSASTPYGKPA